MSQPHHPPAFHLSAQGSRGALPATPRCIQPTAQRMISQLSYLQISNPRVSTGLTSTALDRAPGPSRNFVRGKAGYVPFWPGGLDNLKELNDVVDLQEGSSQLRTTAPGLSRGLKLSKDDEDDADVIGLGGNLVRHSEDAQASVCDYHLRIAIN